MESDGGPASAPAGLEAPAGVAAAAAAGADGAGCTSVWPSRGSVSARESASSVADVVGDASDDPPVSLLAGEPAEGPGSGSRSGNDSALMRSGKLSMSDGLPERRSCAACDAAFSANKNSGSSACFEMLRWCLFFCFV